MLEIVQVQDGQIRIIDDLGNVLGTPADPVRVDPTGTTTQPISNPNLDVALSTRASEVTAAAIAAIVLASLDTTLSSRATQATAAATQAVLEAIRDTAGIKKITDPLPAGTNHIGAVLVDNAAGAAAVNIQDGGNVITVDGSAATGAPAGGVVNVQGVDVVATGAALGALNAAATITINGQQGAGFQLAAGTFVGTIVAEASYDAGTTWNQVPFWNGYTQSFLNSLVFGAANTATALSIFVSSGSGMVRVRVSAYSAGTANATIRASTIPLNAAGVGIGDNKITYSAAITGLVFAASATDIFTITGSASKLVKVTRISFSGTQTTESTRDVRLAKRSTANTVGTSSAPTAVPHDSADPPATATVLAYTANPTLGTLVGIFRSQKVYMSSGTAANDADEEVWEYGARNAKAGVLRGIAEVIGVNMNGVTSSGNNCDLSVEWTEEDY
jgi:hypothetical protein